MVKKILFLTSSYPFGKGESFINPELNSFSKYAKVIVIPTYPRGELKIDKLLANNLEYWSLQLLSFRYILPFVFFLISNPHVFFKLIFSCIDKSVFKTLRNFLLIPKSIYIYYQIRKKNIDFIYAHWLSAPTQLALLLHLMTNIPFGATGHRWDLIDANNFDVKFKYADFIRLISRKSTDFINKDIVEKYNRKIKNIYLGLSLPIFCERKIDYSDNVRILCIGNLIPVKGHKYLIETISILHKKGYKVYLDLIGSGDLEEQLKNQIISLQLQSYINLLGGLPYSEVQNKLKIEGYNLYCQPSVDLGNGCHEGIPVSLMEAMSFGIPCIATDTGSISELIQNDETGLLVEDKNSIALADAILRLLMDPKLTDTIIVNAFKKLSTDFNQELSNQKLSSLMNL